MHKRALRTLLLTLLLVSPGVFAAGWVAILKDTPAERFDDDDLKMFMAAASEALNTEGPVKEVHWTNPDTASGGSFLEMSHSTGTGDMPCKRLKVSVFSKEASEKSMYFTLCKTPKGKWGLASAG